MVVIEDPTTVDVPLEPPQGSASNPARLAAVLVWVDGAPELAGAIIPIDPGGVVFGRGLGEGHEKRARIIRQLPGHNTELAPPTLPWLSRRQLRLQTLDDGRVLVESLGRHALRVRHRIVSDVMVAPGELVVLAERAFFLIATRPETLPAALSPKVQIQALGAVDDVGLVGESPAMWALRERLSFVAGLSGHVLVLGPSGVGKERVAQAIHQLSSRHTRPLIARNAATIPPGLVDAELFGHVANYPNPGMRERPGLVGAADGSTLFLDEIGELSQDVQAHLLRVLDAGQYQRLGSPTMCVSDLRVIGATNRPPERLKDDLRARFRHIVRVPPLGERREDIPLLLRHLARLALSEDRQLATRFSGHGGSPGHDGHSGRTHPHSFEPRISPALVEAVMNHPLPLQIRELESFLWEGIGESSGDTIVCPHVLTERGTPRATPGAQASSAPTHSAETTNEPAENDLPEVDAETLREVIERHGGVLEKVWRELGLRNRYVLRRLMARHGIAGPRSTPQTPPK